MDGVCTVGNQGESEPGSVGRSNSHNVVLVKV